LEALGVTIFTLELVQKFEWEAVFDNHWRYDQEIEASMHVSSLDLLEEREIILSLLHDVILTAFDLTF